jgi:putative peptide zinc metalloprotease protein
MNESLAQTFSENWHRVAGQCAALRPGVQVRPQWFRGEKWFVMHEPFNDQFHRVSPAAWHFIARLDGRRTVEAAWKETMAMDGDDAPGQEETIQLLAQLYQLNFLRGEIAADSALLFQRYRKRRQRETRSLLANLMFPQIPLFDPDRWLLRLLPLARMIFSRGGALAWALVVAWGIKTAFDHAPEFAGQTRDVLAPGNLLPLYAVLFCIKAIHESGHALACRRFGVAVHRVGVSLVFFTPLPFVDATGSWALQNRWHRMVVSMAGIYAEFFVAAVAVLVWAGTAPGPVHAIAFNAMLLASVTTLLFNANPLLRYDGYYILSDLLEIPNLNTRSTAMLRHLAERYLLGVQASVTPAHTTGEAWLLAVYGVASALYRVVLFSGILWIISGKWLLLGVLLAMVCVIQWLLLPPIRFIRYLASSSILARCRPRAIAVSLGGAAAVLALFCAVPFPAHFRAPGMVEAAQYREIFAESSGVVAEVPVMSGSRVHAGQVLARLQNRELDLDLAAAIAARARTLAERDRAINDSPAELEPLRIRLDADEQEIARLRRQVAALEIKAPVDGISISGQLDHARGQWLLRGEKLGDVIQQGEWNFRAVVPQSDSRALFADELRAAEIRFPGAAATAIPVQSFRILPSRQQILPSAALGWMGGGTVEVDAREADGRHALEPFFEVRAVMAGGGAALPRQGRTGIIRFTLPSRPIGVQLWRWLGQLLQQRTLW